MYVCMHVAAYLQLCLPPPASPPLYASVHRYVPIARFMCVLQRADRKLAFVYM